MAAVMTQVPRRGGGLRWTAALMTATPGLFISRQRAGFRCDEEVCEHPWRHGQWYEQCPDDGWLWGVSAACGLWVGWSPELFGGLVSQRRPASALAEALGAWPVDWAADRAALRSVAESRLGRDHLKPWLWDAQLGGLGVPPEHVPCGECPPLPPTDPAGGEDR